MDSATGAAPMPPQAMIMQMAMGVWVSKTMADVSRLGVPDVVKKNGALTPREMVTHGISAHPDSLERALRACASLGLFTESEDGRFGPTELSNLMASDTPGSMKAIVELFNGPAWNVWGGLLDAIRSGEAQARNRLGMEFWDFLNANPEELEAFGEAMKSNSHASLVGVIEKCDFSGATKVVDVAGGFGHLVIALLEKYPELKGVLLDRPEVVPLAKKLVPPAHVAQRLEYIGGNMFESVPAADCYIMKHIIHDWDDARCVRLLSNCRDAMEGNGKVICVDAVLPPMGNTSGAPAKLMDLNMLVFIPGRERTRAQWGAIYRAAGLRIASVIPLDDNFGTSIVEGVKS